MGKVKVKKKCCRSTPRCKSCPVVVLLKARKKAEKKAAKKAAKQELKGLDLGKKARKKDRKNRKDDDRKAA